MSTRAVIAAFLAETIDHQPRADVLLREEPGVSPLRRAAIVGVVEVADALMRAVGIAERPEDGGPPDETPAPGASPAAL